jgi:hypothetical protein
MLLRVNGRDQGLPRGALLDAPQHPPQHQEVHRLPANRGV